MPRIYRGTAGNDILLHAGYDTYFGYDGNDIFIGNHIAETMYGGNGADRLSGSGGVDRLFGESGDDELDGGGGNDRLDGGDGADTLRGEAGIDTMIGGLGDDVYFIDDRGETVTENAGAGIDTVNASVSLVLAANVEKLVLLGTGALDGSGNVLANTLTGNAADNKLDGLAGADVMAGGAGDDTYSVDEVGDVVSELAGGGNDTVLSSVTHTLGAQIENLQLMGTGAINGYGNALANTITGNSGNNTIHGQSGADLLIGGGGDDLYLVENVNDKIIETAGGGVDLVRATIDYTLPDNVENLNIFGSAILNAAGNAQANTINGNGAANVIDGGGGSDTLLAGAGDDTVYLDGGDTVAGAAGVDRFIVRPNVVPYAGADIITDFERATVGEVVDLSLLAPSDPAYTLTYTGQTPGAYGVWQTPIIARQGQPSSNLISVDRSGDGQADALIEQRHVARALGADQLLGVDFGAPNNIPLAKNLTFLTAEDAVLKTGDFKLAGADPDYPTQSLRLTHIGATPITDLNQTVVLEHGVLQLQDGSRFFYTPAPDYHTTSAGDAYNYGVVDGAGAYAEGLFKMVVIPVDDPIV